jgi:hypothetical protein
MSKITAEYDCDKNWINPHKYTISLNDGLTESGWKINFIDGEQKYRVFDLAIGLDVADGRVYLAKEIVQKAFGDRIDADALFNMSHAEMLKYITRDLTREIAFDGKNGNYWIQNLHTLAKHGLYNFLIESGFTKDDFFTIDPDSGRFIFDALLCHPLFRKKIDKLKGKKQPIEYYDVGMKIQSKVNFYGRPVSNWNFNEIVVEDKMKPWGIFFQV